VTVRFLTLTEAAARVGVSPRTVRSWVARQQLQPIPLSRGMLGHHAYAEPDVLAAEKTNRAGRTRRRTVA
jgi:DNA-binding transcriptional MerR regulator